MNVKIGSCQELNVEFEKVATFYENNWARKIALSNVDFYKWQFVNTPMKLGDQCCVALQDNEIIAVMGLNDRDFILKNQSLQAAELTTWIVSENKRGLGLGPKMLDYLQSKYSVLFGMGISNQAVPVYLRKGFKYTRSIPRFVKVLSDSVVEKYGVHTPLFYKLNKIKVRKVDFKCSTPNYKVVNEIFERFSNENNLFSRNFNWLSWRYSNHPSFDYVQKIITNGNNDECIVVYRLDRVDDLIVMHCVDLFGDEGAFASALCFIENEAVKESADIIDFYSTNTKINAHFIARNWFSVLDCDFFDFPHLFHPIEMRQPSTTSLIMWSKEQESSFYDIGNLYISKQDCDFDRPTAANI